MSLSETYARIRSGIVAFVPKHHEQFKPGSLPFEFIFGTGFIVGDSMLATNAHIVDAFEKYRDANGKTAISALLFIKVPQGMLSVSVTVKNASKVNAVHGGEFYYGPEGADVGLVVVDCVGLKKYGMMLNNEIVEEGVEIATAGFPSGSVLMHLEDQLDHVSPTLQRGIISAVLPYAGATLPHGYLANIMVQGGASGSPVFLPDSGDVIGIIHSQRYHGLDTELPSGETLEYHVPINFSHIVPTYYLVELIKRTGTALAKCVAADAPNVDDLLRELPETVTDKLTKGEYRHRKVPEG
jgi:trypsin-like peptidase